LKRDVVCLLRILIDSLPKEIRNSKFLFNFAKFLFGLPQELFSFRDRYEENKIDDLSKYYSKDSLFSLKRISKETDINSFHLRILSKYFKCKMPKSLLDAGCGSAYLLQHFRKLNSSTTLLGIDYQTLPLKSEQIEFIEGDILKTLQGFLVNSFDFVVCTHVIEHLDNPREVIMELRRVCSETLIIICPLEKKFKWGMNYHVNFYSSQNQFINFYKGTVKESENYKLKYETFLRLGDLMFIEHINKKL
tara:strand:- start:1057 stop:1800 length:744 start_codon:yes stop_codon:yes gene_type:complete